MPNANPPRLSVLPTPSPVSSDALHALAETLLHLARANESACRAALVIAEIRTRSDAGALKLSPERIERAKADVSWVNEQLGSMGQR